MRILLAALILTTPLQASAQLFYAMDDDGTVRFTYQSPVPIDVFKASEAPAPERSAELAPPLPISRRPGKRTFDPGTRAERLSRIDPIIQEAARYYAIPAPLIRAVAENESAFHACIESRTGAVGIMQLMPATAEAMGIRADERCDPYRNIFAGTRYLRLMLNRYHGDVALALAAYNAGPGAVDRYGGVPPYAETQRAVPTVLGLYDRTSR